MTIVIDRNKVYDIVNLLIKEDIDFTMTHVEKGIELEVESDDVGKNLAFVNEHTLPSLRVEKMLPMDMLEEVLETLKGQRIGAEVILLERDVVIKTITGKSTYDLEAVADYIEDLEKMESNVEEVDSEDMQEILKRIGTEKQLKTIEAEYGVELTDKE